MSARNSNRARHPERGNRARRLLDRFVGGPLVLILGLLRSRRESDARREVRNAAFLHTAAIGDTIISSALVQDLKKAYPSSRITYFTGSSNHDAAKLIPGIDDVVQLPVTSPLRSIAAIRRAGAFDIWFDLGPWPRLNAVYSFFARAALTVGFRTEGEYRHYAYDIAAQHLSGRHEVDNYREMLHAAGIAEARSLPRLVAATEQPRPDNIVVHMFPGGSRSYLKEWPEERWVELIEELTNRNYTVTLTGASGDRGKAEEVRSRVSRKEKVDVAAGRYPLRALSGLLKASRLTISVDTGIMHLASALGCNLISLHGPTSPARWGPLNTNSVSLTSGMTCSPCLSLGFEDVCARGACMERITVDEVLAASLKFLESPSHPRAGATSPLPSS